MDTRSVDEGPGGPGVPGPPRANRRDPAGTSEAPRERIPLGVVGCGRVLERYHLPGLRASSDWRLVGAVDSRPDRIAWLNQALPAVPAYRSLAELLEAASPRAVLIATPPESHARLAKASLGYGAHVLVEKPGGLSSAEAREMKAHADRAGRVLWVGLNRRFHLSFRTVKERLHGWQPAAPTSLRSEFCFSVGRWGPVTGYLGDPARGGGPLHDVLSHQLDLLAWMVGRPIGAVRVLSWGQVSSGEEILEYEARFEGELVASGLAGHTASYRETVEVEAGDHRLLAQPAGIVTGPAGSWAQIHRRAAAQAWIVRKLIRLGISPDRMASSFRNQWDAFARAVRGESIHAEGADAAVLVGLHRALEAVARSGQLGGSWCEV